jgi:hypothetical protein
LELTIQTLGSSFLFWNWPPKRLKAPPNLANDPPNGILPQFETGLSPATVQTRVLRQRQWAIEKLLPDGLSPPLRHWEAVTFMNCSDPKAPTAECCFSRLIFPPQRQKTHRRNSSTRLFGRITKIRIKPTTPNMPRFCCILNS